MKDKFSELIKEYRRFWFLPVMVIAGLLMMSYQSELPKATEVTAEVTDQQYVNELEERVENMLLNIAGAGKCEVTITLASGVQKEYVREEGAVLVITDKSGNEVPVVAGERLPEIAGVTVVSTGAGNIRIQTEIINSVGTLLNVGSNKIYVVSREGNYYEDQ